MLKLVNAFQINYSSIIEYRLSFEKNLDELPYELYVAKIDKSVDYYRYLIENGIDHCYFLIDDENPNYILGNGIIYTYLDFNLDTGTIGYAIRPNERNKGYGNTILKLLLDVCVDLNIEYVGISCYQNNIASKKIIEKNGGVFEKTFTDSNLIGLKYLIETENIKQNVKMYN